MAPGSPPGLSDPPTALAHPLSVFSLNAYLVPAFFLARYNNATSTSTSNPSTGEPAYDLASCVDQIPRADRIAAAAGKLGPDIISLQEAWGGAADVLGLGLARAGYRMVAGAPWVFGGWLIGSTLADVVNTAWSYVWGLGGLLSCVKDHDAGRIKSWTEWLTLGLLGRPAPSPNQRTIHLLRSYHHTFQHCEGEDFMRKSCSFLLLDVASHWGPNTRLLVLNTHLHSPEPFTPSPHRAKQLDEIRTVLHKLRSEWKSLFVSFGRSSPASQDDEDEEESERKAWRRTAVILCGDLNTSYLSGPLSQEPSNLTEGSEYLSMLASLSAKDLFLSGPPNDARKKQLTYDPEHNPYVADRYRQSGEEARMDYILSLSHLLPLSSSSFDLESQEHQSNSLEFMQLDGRIEVVKESGKGVMSDHWGLLGVLWPSGATVDGGVVEELVKRIPG